MIVSSVMFPVRLFASSIVCQFDCFGKPAPVFSNDCLFPVLCFCDACLFDCSGSIVSIVIVPVERYGIACQRDYSSVIVPVDRYGIACQCDCFQFDCLPV